MIPEPYRRKHRRRKYYLAKAKKPKKGMSLIDYLAWKRDKDPKASEPSSVQSDAQGSGIVGSGFNDPTASGPEGSGQDLT